MRLLKLAAVAKGGALVSAAMAVAAGWAGGAAAQAPTQTIERTMKARPNTATQIGIYLNVLPDCSSGPLPTIRLASPPSVGKVIVRRAKAKATNYKTCLALEVPAYVAFYRAPANFTGQATMTLVVKYRGGRTEIQKFTVDVSGPGPRQKI